MANFKKATLQSVAVAAGVSRSAVSKAMSGGGGKTTKISDATRRKIIEVAQKLNYSPDHTARMLRSGHSKFVGLLFKNTGDRFYGELLNLLTAELAAQGYVAINAFFYSVDDFGAAYNTLMEYRPAGIISCHDEFDYQGQVPVVLYTQGTREEHDCVSFDFRERYSGILAYVAANGARRLGTIGTQEFFPEMCRARGFEIRNEWCFPGSYYPDGIAAAGKLMEKRGDWPQLMVCANDQCAMSFIAELQSCNCKVPDDISVLGFDNIAESQHVTPRLTTFYYDIDELARSLVQLTLRRIQQPDAEITHITLHQKLVERSSCRKYNRTTEK